MAASKMERNSAGRLLRTLRDSQLSHMELAIAEVDLHVQADRTEIRSVVGSNTHSLEPRASLEKNPGCEIWIREGGNASDATGQSPKEPVLALSDHKRIANLQSVLSTLAKAYAPQDGHENTHRNLVCAVASAAVTQTMRDCTASRANPCIWGPQAQKLHALLYWMVKRESMAVNATPGAAETSTSRDFVREMLLAWLQPTVDKQKPLAATLVLFELLQIHRRNMRSLRPENESLSLLGRRSDAFVDSLLGLVNRGSIQLTDSSRVKPSKLALMALETLILLCGDLTAQFMTSSGANRLRTASSGELRKVVEAMRTGLRMLRQWHLHSTRRRYFVYALEHLQSYATTCSRLLATEGDVKDSETTAILDALCWHWQATAPLLCTRSDATIRMRKNRPTEMLGNTLRLWGSRALSANAGAPQRSPGGCGEFQYAQLRYVCILMNLIGGAKELSRAFDSFKAEGKAYFLVLFVQGLLKATCERSDPAILMAVKSLRAALLDTEELKLLSSTEEEQALMSQLLWCIRNYYAGRETPSSTTAPRGQTQLEFFVADFIIQRELPIAVLQAQLAGLRADRVLGPVSLVRVLLYQLDSGARETSLCGLWRRQLTPAVLGLLGDESYSVRRLALSCLPALDRALCVRALCAMDETLVDSNLVFSVLGALFSTSTGSVLEAMANEFVDACRFGCTKESQQPGGTPTSPRWWYNQAKPPNLSNAGGENGAVACQERLLLLCFGNNGWSKRISSPANRATILHSVLHKIFGSPRDTVLLRILREFVAVGWVASEASELVMRVLVGHASTQPRLSEAFLDDDSPSSAQRVEALLFARLAPMLVLRILPRASFRSTCENTLLCGREDLAHLEQYTDDQLRLDEAEEIDEEHERKVDATSKQLFHLLARSIVDPLEFKEVKMLAAENLAKFPPRLVLPFVLAHLTAFLREEQPLSGPWQGQDWHPFAVREEDIPLSCGLVSAKLMVYYLNRMLAEDDYAYKDIDIVSAALAVLVQILGIPCIQDPSAAANQALLTDLQRGCIDCISLLLSKVETDGDSEAVVQEKGETTESQVTASSLMRLLLRWIFREPPTAGEGHGEVEGGATLGPRTQFLLESVWGNIQQDGVPLQVRICCCNVLLSALSRAEDNVLVRWKTQGVVSYVAAATARCDEENEEDIIAGGLQILFSFLYKAGEMLTIEREDDLQLVRDCYEVTLVVLESTRSEKAAMSGLKVVGALIGKLPAFVGTLPPAELQRLIDGCLISLRDRCVSVVVSELAQSLLHALTAS